MVRNLTGGAGGVFLAAALAPSLGLLLAGAEAQVRGSGASSRVEVFTRRGLVSLPWSLPAASLASLTGVEVSGGGGGDWGTWQ